MIQIKVAEGFTYLGCSSQAKEGQEKQLHLEAVSSQLVVQWVGEQSGDY